MFMAEEILNDARARGELPPQNAAVTDRPDAPSQVARDQLELAHRGAAGGPCRFERAIDALADVIADPWIVWFQ